MLIDVNRCEWMWDPWSPWRVKASMIHDTLSYFVTWLLNMAVGIVDLPIKNGGSFHSYVNVYQRIPKYARCSVMFVVIFPGVSTDPCWFGKDLNLHGL